MPTSTPSRLTKISPTTCPTKHWKPPRTRTAEVLFLLVLTTTMDLLAADRIISSLLMTGGRLQGDVEQSRWTIPAPPLPPSTRLTKISSPTRFPTRHWKPPRARRGGTTGLPPAVTTQILPAADDPAVRCAPGG